jgi:hypothetical protein
MRISASLRFGVLITFLTAASAGAQCVSGATAVSLRGVAPYRAAEAVAFSGTRFGVLKVGEAPSNALHFTTFDAALTVRTADVEIAPQARTEQLSLLWADGEFAVFFLDPSRRVMLQRLTEQGVAIGPPVQILQQFFLSRPAELDFAWDATRRAFVIAHTIPSSGAQALRISVVAPDGTMSSSQVAASFVGDTASPRIAVNGGGTVLVAYQRDSAQEGFSFALIGPDDQYRGGGFLVTGRDAQIASDGENFAGVAFNAAATPRRLRWAAVNAAGGTVVGERTLLTTQSVALSPVGLIWNATLGEWALTYLDLPFGPGSGDLRLTRFTSSGALVADGHYSAVFPLIHFETEHPPVWTGSAYVSVLSEFISPQMRTESYLAVNCPLAAVIDEVRDVYLVNQQATFFGSAIGGQGPYTYSWDVGDGSLRIPGQSARYIYTFPGTFTVTLRITDAAGVATSASRTVRVFESFPKRRALKR